MSILAISARLSAPAIRTTTVARSVPQQLLTGEQALEQAKAVAQGIMG